MERGGRLKGKILPPTKKKAKKKRNRIGQQLIFFFHFVYGVVYDAVKF
jgi:hypothetical protein